MAGGYTAEFEYRPELSTTGEQEPEHVCERCGEPFFAYEIPGRETYRCNDCKMAGDGDE